MRRADLAYMAVLPLLDALAVKGEFLWEHVMNRDLDLKDGRLRDFSGNLYETIEEFKEQVTSLICAVKKCLEDARLKEWSSDSHAPLSEGVNLLLAARDDDDVSRISELLDAGLG